MAEPGDGVMAEPGDGVMAEPGGGVMAEPGGGVMAELGGGVIAVPGPAGETGPDGVPVPGAVPWPTALRLLAGTLPAFFCAMADTPMRATKIAMTSLFIIFDSKTLITIEHRMCQDFSAQNPPCVGVMLDIPSEPVAICTKTTKQLHFARPRSRNMSRGASVPLPQN
jgi:hypothetical protein